MNVSWEDIELGKLDTLLQEELDGDAPNIKKENDQSRTDTRIRTARLVTAAVLTETPEVVEEDSEIPQRPRPVRGQGAAGLMSQQVQQKNGSSVMSVVAGILIVVVTVALIGNFLKSTPTATTINGTPVATDVVNTTAIPVGSSEAPQPTETPLTFAQATQAYAAPSGAIIGPLEAGRAYKPVAKYGNTWIQVDVGSPGQPNKVWVMATAVVVQGNLPDLTPKADQPVVAPQLPVEDVCTLADKKFSTTLTIIGKVKSGQVIGYGCTQAEADANAAALAKEYK